VRSNHHTTYESVPREQDVLERIRLEMENHLRENAAPEDVHDFLVRHWARLMTGIYMAKGNQDADWVAGWDTVNALLWSLAPKHGRQETEKMLRMLPAILARLQEGCGALAMPRPERDVLFERLAMMHAAVAREGLRYQVDSRDIVTSMGGIAGLDVAETELAELAQSVRAIVEPDSPGHPEPALGLPGLKPGDRLHFKRAGEDRIVVVNWISPMGGMFMFTNEQGLDALTLTRARLAERFAAGTASQI
jgi:hypothetical protein